MATIWPDDIAPCPKPITRSGACDVSGLSEGMAMMATPFRRGAYP